jgi:hypothetical protein
MPISNPSNSFGNSQFVVDPVLGGASFQTITAALAASSSGDTIYIRPGTYTENLTANLSGRSLIAASSGSNAFEVIVVGNHTLTSTGSVSFQGIDFSASSGTCFAVGGAGAGTYSADFEVCRIRNSAGVALSGSSAAGSANLRCFYSIIDGSTQGANLANGTSLFDGCAITGGASNAMECGAACNVQSTNNTYGAAASNAILLSNAGASFISRISSYSSLSAAFRFTANGSARSLSEEINSNDASGNFITSSGAFGLFSYAGAILLGTATGLDPQINSTALPVISSSALVTQSITANQTLQVNHRYIVSSGTLSLLLPATADVGDTIIVSLKGGTSFTITQGAGQSIQLGQLTSTVGAGGSVASTASGDSITLICSTANTAYYAEKSVGNFTIV